MLRGKEKEKESGVGKKKRLEGEARKKRTEDWGSV